MIILDFGSGETCKNDEKYVEKMIDSLAMVDKGDKDIVIKWQLFNNIPYKDRKLSALKPVIFLHAYVYAEKYGYKTTASVFDLETLIFLSCYDVPFIKLANRPELYEYSRVIRATGHKAVVSVGNSKLFSRLTKEHESVIPLCCVSEYPALAHDYIKTFGNLMHEGLSDHTTDFFLYHTYQPKIYECHYKLEDSTGPDAGVYARTPEQLKEIL